MARVGVTREVRGRSGACLLLCVAGSIALSDRSWSFCSLPSTGIFSSRSVSKVQVRFMGMDKNKDGVISPEEFRSGMQGVSERGKFHMMDFFGAVGLNQDEISTVFTVVGEEGRQRLWDAMQDDLDLGTVKKGFPHFNSELNAILPGLPRFNSGFFPLDRDGDGQISDEELQEGVDMICAKSKIDSDEFFKRIDTSWEDLRKTFLCTRGPGPRSVVASSCARRADGKHERLCNVQEGVAS